MWARLPFLTPIILGIKNLRIRLWRTLLTLVGISLGVAVVLAIEITNKSTLQSIENIFGQATGKAELVVIPNADQNDFDGRIIDRIQKASGVYAAVPALKVRTLIENEDAGSEAHWGVRGVELGRSFEVRGFDATLNPLLQVYNLVEGGFPSRSKFEIMVTQKFAEDKSYKLGNYLPIVTPTGTVRVKIVGLLSEEGAGLVNDGQVGFVPYNVVQQIFDIGHNVNEILIQVEPGIGSNPKMLEELKTNLQTRIGPDAQVVYSSARGNILPEMLNTYQIGLTTFSIIAIVVGAFLIYNTFTMTVVERTREIGMLRAIGMSRKQVLELILAEAFILSAMGSVLGVFCGFYLAQGLVILQSGFIQVKDINLALTTEDVLKSIGIGLAITYISALIPALQASRISPIEALRAKSRSIEKVNPTIWILGVLLAFIGWLFLYQIPWREDVLMIMGNIGFFSILVGFVLTVPIAVGIFGKVSQSISTFFYRMEGKLGAENIKRSVSRTMLTVASLMIALIMIIGINSLAYSLKVDIQTWTNSAMAGDLFISATESFRQSFTQTLIEVPGIKSISPATYLTVKFSSIGFPKQESLPESLTFTAIDPVLYRQVGDMVFSSGQGQKEEIWREFSSGDKLFISTVVSEKTGLEQGDYLTLITKRGEHAFKIAAVNTDFASQGLTITGTYSDLKHWFSDTNINRFTVSLLPGYNPESVTEKIKERFGHLYTLNVLAGKTIKDSVFGLLDQAFVLFDVLSLIGVVIGSIGVINTLSMNILERTRELGGMRALGMTRGQIMRMVLAESLALGFMGGVYGIFLGYPVSLIFIHVLNSLGGYEVEFFFNPSPYIIGLFIAFGVSQIAALGPSRRASNLNIIEAIMHE